MNAKMGLSKGREGVPSLAIIVLIVLALLLEGGVRGQGQGRRGGNGGRGQGAMKPIQKYCKGGKPSDEGFLSRCNGVIKCPNTCPKCVLSCKSCGMVKCPKCNKVGSVCQDPRFVGGDGVTFYFHGHKDADFCLVSDRKIHINAHFIGKRPLGRPRDFTWVQAIAVLFGDHKLYVGAKKVATWETEVDQFVLYYDKDPIKLPTHVGQMWRSHDGEVEVSRGLKPTNMVTLGIRGLFNASISIVPVTMEDSRVHNYGIKDDDCFAHLEVNFDFVKLSKSVEGILGQTYAPGYLNPVNTKAEMPIMGGEHKYLASSIFSPDCQAAVFKGRSFGGEEEEDFTTLLIDSEIPQAKCGSREASLFCQR